MCRVIAMGMGMLLGGSAWAGGSASLAYGPVGALDPHGSTSVESSIVARTTVFPEDGPLGLGVSARAHGGPQGFDLGVTPDLCAGTIQDAYLLQVCGGLTLYNTGWRDGQRTHGLLSPVVEPTLGIPLAGGDGGALFVSVPVGYDVRYGQEGAWWAGITLGFGAFGE